MEINYQLIIVLTDFLVCILSQDFGRMSYSMGMDIRYPE